MLFIFINKYFFLASSEKVQLHSIYMNFTYNPYVESFTIIFLSIYNTIYL